MTRLLAKWGSRSVRGRALIAAGVVTTLAVVGAGGYLLLVKRAADVQVFESELGEYNPVISDGQRLYLTGASGIRAFEHETKAQRKGKAERLERQRALRKARKARQREARATRATATRR